LGKAEVLWEETVKCTIEAAGVWVLTSIEGFTEITTGKSYFQQGLTTTCKDRSYRLKLKGIRRI
jgi:hypothetical protein